jgi:hypothetical protein
LNYYDAKIDQYCTHFGMSFYFRQETGYFKGNGPAIAYCKVGERWGIIRLYTQKVDFVIFRGVFPEAVKVQPKNRRSAYGHNEETCCQEASREEGCGSGQETRLQESRQACGEAHS